MKYKQFVYTPVIILISLKLIAAEEQQNEGRGFSETSKHESKLERILAMWNRSSTSTTENSVHSNMQFFPNEEGFQGNTVESDSEQFFASDKFAQNFPLELSKCIENHQYQITENYGQGKNIIFNCFKATLMLNLIKHLGASSRSSIKLFNGLLEVKKIPDKTCREMGDNPDGIRNKYCRFFEGVGSRSDSSHNKKKEYIKMYQKAMEKLVYQKAKFNLRKNQTQEDNATQLKKINEASKKILSEILKNVNDENVEKLEEEKLQKEITDPKLMPILDAVTRNYMLKVKFYPGVSARVMRSYNGGVTFDLEIDEPQREQDEEEEDVLSNESTREIKDSRPQAKDYFDDDDSDEGGVINKKKSKKGNKKKKKEMKKKAKKLKKIIPYLLLPILIQMTLLPFVFKKLFFLAMKALFAGKMALILVGFNLLRNTCIKGEDKYAQRIRVEHYGYNKGEEYGAWINGRSIHEPSMMAALSEEPFKGQRPISS